MYCSFQSVGKWRDCAGSLNKSSIYQDEACPTCQGPYDPEAANDRAAP